MATQRTSATAIKERHRRIVKEIEKKFGKVIDLERTPSVLVEIIREFGDRFDTNGGGGSGGGGGVSSIAVGITPPTAGIEDTLIIKTLLTMQRDIKALGRKLDQMTPAK